MILKKYWYIWFRTSLLSLQSLMVTRWSSILYLMGKFLRFLFFLQLFLSIGRQVQDLNGYSAEQLIIIYLVYNFFDLLGQIFFRGIYWFRADLVSGDFDFYLLRPLNVVFQVLTRRTDLLDVPLFVLVASWLGYIGYVSPELSLISFLVFALISLSLVTCIHVIVAAIGILTMEVDYTIWLYRDLALLTRLPVTSYQEWLRWFLMVIIPVGIIFTIPAQALMNQLNPELIGGVIGINLAFFWLTHRLWKYALKQYTSASS